MAVQDRDTGKADIDNDLVQNEQKRMPLFVEKFKNLWDSCVNRTTDRGVLFGVPKTLGPMTIPVGTTDVVTTVGIQARQIRFTDADGWPIEIAARAKPGSEATTIEVYSLEEYENVTINLNCWI
jgi:hypothetical protein